MSSRSIYLNKVSLAEAKQKIIDQIDSSNQQWATEVVSVREAVGRISAQQVSAKRSAPHYYAAAMDGIAVQAESTFGASDRMPVELTLGKEAILIDTGDPLPAEFDSVIMIENVKQLAEDRVEITSSAAPGQNIRSIGEDFFKEESLITANSKITPADSGGLLAAGVTEIEVKSQPEVAILPTGTELIDPAVQDLKPGEIVEYNSQVISSQLVEWGAKPEVMDSLADDYERIKNKLLELSQQYDLVVLIAGSSAGREDYTAQIIDQLGELLFHGVAIKPGKPMLAGVVNDTLVLGVPGYPVSAYLSSQLVLKPVIEQLLNYQLTRTETLVAELTQDLTSKLGSEEFIRVNIAQVGDSWKAVPLSRGAGIINSVMKCDGFLRIPALGQGLNKGETVEVELRAGIDYQQNLLVGSSEQIISSKLENSASTTGLNLKLKKVDRELSLEYLDQQMLNLAIIEVAESEAEEALIADLQLKDQVVLDLADFEVGLAFLAAEVEINNLTDLVEQDLSLINQPANSASRLLLEQQLASQGLTAGEINGYQRTAASYLGAANLVASGLAEVGVSSRLAADRLDLDFVSLGRVELKLVIPPIELERDLVQDLVHMIKTKGF
ncbi:MAG: substrate-binding domain-containing protein [Bacillota bacterium]